MRSGPLTIVSIGFVILAQRASAFDKSVRQKRFGNWIVKLLNLALADQSGRPNCRPELPAQFAVFRRMRAAIIVKFDVKAGEIALVLFVHPADERLFADASPLGAN